jgi:3-methylcrotonyl-CoA carboxylase alpha subunit
MEARMKLQFERRGGALKPVEVPAERNGVIRSAGKIRAVDFAGRRTRVRAVRAGARIFVWCEGETFAFLVSPPRASRARGSAEEAGLRAPMPGKILRTVVREGEQVARGATLLVLEAMKMEHDIKAPREGRVSRMPFSEGDQVEAGAVLVEFA